MKRPIMSWMLVLALLWIAIVQTGCFRVTYVTGKPIVGKPIRGTNHFFVGGVAGFRTVELAEKCPNGVSKLRVYMGPIDAILSFLTLTIYTPRSYKVWCHAGSATDAPAKKPSSGPMEGEHD